MNVENRPNLSIQIGIHCQVIDNWLIKTTIHFDRTAKFRLFVVMSRFKISRLESYFHYTSFDFISI